MKKSLLTIPAVLAVTLGLMTSAAAGASNPVNGTCFAGFVSDQSNDVGGTISVVAREERPFGTTLPAFIPGFKCPPE